MERCLECNRYNVFDSKAKTEKIKYLVAAGYDENQLKHLCIDCINKEYNKVKNSEYNLKALNFIAKAHEKDHPDLCKEYSKEDLEGAQKILEEQARSTLGEEAYKLFITKYF